MTDLPGYLDQPVGTFLDRLAAGTPAPAGGCAAALTVALAGALCAKTARLSARQLTAQRADELTALAERMRTAAASLIDADALAYSAVIEAARRPADAATQPAAPGTGPANPAAPGTQPSAALAAALSRAADVPMQVVELAADVAELAAALAANSNPATYGDAITAALLAESGARAAAQLVAINLAAAPDDPRHTRAAQLLTEVRRAACRRFHDLNDTRDSQ